MPPIAYTSAHSKRYVSVNHVYMRPFLNSAAVAAMGCNGQHICSVEGGGHQFVPDLVCLENQGPRKYFFGSLIARVHVVFRSDLEGWWRMTRQE